MSVHLRVVREYLEEQQDLRAVQRFAKEHASKELRARRATSDEAPAPQGLYQALIPLSRPGPGQQYAFQVDLDACTGCKACVVACNKLNGLDTGEAWRMVGLIHGGTAEAPVQRTVTTACHHCLDPACANGCPVGAYEKDSETGIVRHLDDQCIGCQYCTLTCPYEVPQYNKRLGIVRKCDMCSGRLAAGEPPACVRACPNGAISIRIVDRQAVLDDAQGDAFLPGAPSPGITAPTTTFKTERALPRNVLPVNFYDVRPADKHVPLVVMLVLTQLSVGAFCIDALWSWNELSILTETLGRAHSLVALSLGLIALGASVFHLGRPLYAFRAFIGLRRSWMSREIIAFGLFAKVAVLYALSRWRPELFDAVGVTRLLGISTTDLQRGLSLAVALSGLLGVLCSVMIYRATHRQWWNGTTTAIKFLGTCGVLGVGTLLLTATVTGLALPDTSVVSALPLLTGWLVVLGGAKLAYEASIFFHLFDKQQGDLKRTALLMVGELAPVTRLRFVLGVFGALLLPAGLYLARPEAVTGPVLFTTSLCFLALIGGELAERMLFFSAVSAPRMPGALGK